MSCDFIGRVGYSRITVAAASAATTAVVMAALVYSVQPSILHGKNIASDDSVAGDVSRDASPTPSTAPSSTSFRAMRANSGPLAAARSAVLDGSAPITLASLEQGPSRNDPAASAKLAVASSQGSAAAAPAAAASAAAEASPFLDWHKQIASLERTRLDLELPAPRRLNGRLSTAQRQMRDLAIAVGREFARRPGIGKADLSEASFVALFLTMIRRESNFNPRAVSPVGARGLGQLMPATAQHLGVDNSFVPHENLRGAATYLTDMLDKFEEPELALAAYNAGPGAVSKYDGIPPYRETRQYVSDIFHAVSRTPLPPSGDLDSADPGTDDSTPHATLLAFDGGDDEPTKAAAALADIVDDLGPAEAVVIDPDDEPAKEIEKKPAKPSAKRKTSSGASKSTSARKKTGKSANIDAMSRKHLTETRDRAPSKARVKSERRRKAVLKRQKSDRAQTGTRQVQRRERARETIRAAAVAKAAARRKASDKLRAKRERTEVLAVERREQELARLRAAAVAKAAARRKAPDKFRAKREREEALAAKRQKQALANKRAEVLKEAKARRR